MTETVENIDSHIKIQNVVASASLSHGIDVNVIAKVFPHTDYNPDVFPGLVFRLRRPKTTTLIFASGKMICTGGKSAREAQLSIKKVVKMLKGENIVIKGKPDITVQNIVASANLEGKVDLLRFYVKSADDADSGVMYEPEQFPGLIYRMQNPRAVILVFASGKLVCTGTRKEAETFKAVGKIRQRLEKHQAINYTT